MKSKFLFSVILVAGLMLLNFSDSQVYGQTQQKKTDAVQTMKYTCPMHSQVIKDKPGKCPICEMKLVIKKEPSNSLMQQMNDSTMMKNDHMKMMHDSTTMKKGAMMHDTIQMKGGGMMNYAKLRRERNMMNDSTMMKKGQMMHDTTSMRMNRMKKK